MGPDLLDVDELEESWIVESIHLESRITCLEQILAFNWVLIVKINCGTNGCHV